MFTKLITCFLVFLVVFSSCTPSSDSDDGLLIVATTGMVADAVKQVAGPSVRVEALMGPGVDPHLYKATQGDLQLLREADIIVYNGLHLEGKMQEVFDKLSAEKPVIAMSGHLDPQRLLAAGNQQSVYDPHIWFDVALWADAVQGMAKDLSKAAPELSDTLFSRSATYGTLLQQLHRETDSLLQTIPNEKRILITSHDAFHYFGHAYHFEVRGLQGISTAAEFGLKDITDMVQYITENKIPAVFVESSVSEKAIISVIEGCKDKGHNLQLGGILYSDAMGAANTPEGTYIGMVRANVKTLIQALQ